MDFSRQQGNPVEFLTTGSTRFGRWSFATFCGMTSSPSTPSFPNADDLIERNSAYSETLDGVHFDVRPSRSLAVVACMDSRMDMFSLLGLQNGEAHIIRNAGGAVTDDTIRSLCLSQRFLGTREIILVHHTDCGLYQLDENAFKADLQAELGVRPTWALESFNDPYEDTRQSIRRIELSPFVSHTDHIRGFVYDVDTGLLDEVLE